MKLSLRAIVILPLIAIAMAIKKIGVYDYDYLRPPGFRAGMPGMLGPGIAEYLGLPVITVAKKIEINRRQTKQRSKG